MSTLKTNAAQIGQSVTATNNFTLYTPNTPDGTVRLGVGNAGSVSDLISFNGQGISSLLAASDYRLTDYGSNTRIRRTFPFNNNGTPVQWSRLGRVSIMNGSQGSSATGGGCIIRVLGSEGFNATDIQLGYSEIVMWGSNNVTAPNNINGKFSTTGRRGVDIVKGVKAVSVNNTQFDNTYDIWVNSLFYAPNGMVEVTTSDGWIWSWADNYGTLTTTDPGAASNTVRVFKNKSPSYGAAAYAKFTGAGVIQESYNISSVTKSGTLDFIVTFSQPMSDTNYSIVGTSSFNPGVDGNVPLTVNSDAGLANATPTTGFIVRTTNGNPTFISVVVFSNF